MRAARQVVVVGLAFASGEPRLVEPAATHQRHGRRQEGTALEAGPAASAAMPPATVLSAEVLAALPAGQMTPFVEELLERPIVLEGCPGVRIVERRTTPGQEAAEGPSPSAVEVLAATCAIALDAFEAFVAREVPGDFAVPAYWSLDVSLLPLGKEGPIARTLADHDGRFASRDKTPGAHDRPVGIWGYTDFTSRFVFVRSDVLLADGSANQTVLTVLAHELFHALSWQSGLHASHSAPRSVADEALARRFTAALGLGRAE